MFPPSIIGSFSVIWEYQRASKKLYLSLLRIPTNNKLYGLSIIRASAERESNLCVPQLSVQIEIILNLYLSTRRSLEMYVSPESAEITTFLVRDTGEREPIDR